MLATKASFTEEQRAAVLALQPAPAEAAAEVDPETGEFAAAYRRQFGELPSQTLGGVKRQDQ